MSGVAGDVTRAVTRELRGFTESSFGDHASLEAIDAAMKDADNATSITIRHVAWLQDLKHRRKTEIENGAWPPAGSDGE